MARVNPFIDWLAAFDWARMPAPFCGLHDLLEHHHHGEHHTSIEGNLLGAAIVTVWFGFFLSPFGGGLILLLTRRIRNLFWAIPAANLLLFAALVALYTYRHPASDLLRFAAVLVLVGEGAFIVVVSLFYAALLAIACIVVRFLWKKLRGHTGRCPACGYDLRGNPGATTCPECGHALSPTSATPLLSK